uniref:Putative LOV domain-containing protein n=1 Tax=Frankenia laevis TaxID=122303 RepID=A0A126X3C0_9CARY|nr:putative LOV domain-containing protein [Frankenia laevis]
MESPFRLTEESFNAQYSSWVQEALDELDDNFTITDPCISGHPIVFASRGFLKMCGYSKEEVIGRNGRIFQGPLTDRRTVMEIREAIREERAIQISILNYRKDGKPFWMLFHMTPVFSAVDGRVVHFVGTQVPILRRVTRSTTEVCEGRHLSCEIKVGTCRREVCSDPFLQLRHNLAVNSVLISDEGDELEEFCEASELEKQKASTAIHNILSVLTHYSQLTGRSVTGRRCSVQRTCLPNSALTISLGRIKQSFVLTDPQLPNIPIVYASDAFLRLTGYDRHEVLGRSCKFLTGPDTDSSTVSQINGSIHHGQTCTVHIIHYRKDKSSYWSLVHSSPVRNASGKIAYFIELHIEDDMKNQEIKHTPSPGLKQLGAVGAVKVAVRSLSMGPASSSW